MLHLDRVHKTLIAFSLLSLAGLLGLPPSMAALDLVAVIITPPPPQSGGGGFVTPGGVTPTPPEPGTPRPIPKPDPPHS